MKNSLEHSAWGENKLGFFSDGSVDGKINHRPAIGYIDYNTSPPSIVVFRCLPFTQAIHNINGKHQITGTCPIIDKSTQQELSTVQEYCKNN